MQTLDWAYQRAMLGLPGTGSSGELARDYCRNGESFDKAADSLIRWQVGKASLSGFVSSFGGLLLVPLTLPSGLAVTLYVQLRMIAAIAQLGGYDPRSDQVRTLCFACLMGSGAGDLVKDFGVQLGAKVAETMVEQIPSKVLLDINKKVGFKLLTKLGPKGLIKLGRVIPVVGGLVGAAFDAAATLTIGKVAKSAFRPISQQYIETVTTS